MSGNKIEESIAINDRNLCRQLATHQPANQSASRSVNESSVNLSMDWIWWFGCVNMRVT